MFGFIRKKNLEKYIREIKDENRAANNGQNYDEPISKAQQKTNIYAQGYEDGTDNFYNAVCARFGIKAHRGGHRRAALASIKSLACRELETIVTVEIDDIVKNAAIPMGATAADYKAGVEERVRRALTEGGFGDAYTRVKVQVFTKDE